MIRRTFDAKIREVGNSHIITIPMNIIKKYNLKINEFIELTIKIDNTK